MEVKNHAHNHPTPNHNRCNSNRSNHNHTTLHNNRKTQHTYHKKRSQYPMETPQTKNQLHLQQNAPPHKKAR